MSKYVVTNIWYIFIDRGFCEVSSGWRDLYSLHVIANGAIPFPLLLLSLSKNSNVFVLMLTSVALTLTFLTFVTPCWVFFVCLSVCLSGLQKSVYLQIGISPNRKLSYHEQRDWNPDWLDPEMFTGVWFSRQRCLFSQTDRLQTMQNGRLRQLLSRWWNPVFYY